MKYGFLLLFLNCYIYSFSQTNISGQVLSKSTNQPVAFATIFLKKSAIGVHSDQEGKFEIGSSIVQDSILIRALGYKTLILPYKRDIKEAIFYLKDEPILLPTFTFKKSVKPRLVQKGATIDKSNIVFGQMGSSDYREIALFIPNDEFKEGYLKNISFFVARFGKYKTPFRVHFYEPENLMPGRELVLQPVILQAKRPNDYSTYDVSELDIPFGKNGIFISMEWLNLNNRKYFYKVSYPKTNSKREFYGQQVGMTKEFDEDLGRKRVGNGDWKNLNKFSAPMIRAKIEIYD